MATSGTIGSTTIKTSNLLEKAVRRCGMLPSMLTAEAVDTATESLFMLLMSLSNRGLNLWCVDKKLMALEVYKATYQLPIGTQAVLNLLHCVPSIVTGTDTSDANNYQTELTDASSVVRFAVEFSVSPASFDLQTSSDGVTWATVQTITEVAESATLGWYNVDPSATAIYFRVHSASAITVSQFLLATEVREVMVAKFNRDDYANQPNKTQLSNQVTNYYFEKLIQPQITVWPVPNDSTRHLSLFRYRQIQDVGTLTQELEIPARWYEAICWHLALRLAFELPAIDAARRQEIKAMADSMVIEVEDGETDNAPSYFAPNIGVYNR
jgi:hypothetical protein